MSSSVRARILAIALIPSIVLAIAVAGVVRHLTTQARQDRAWADVTLRTAPYAVEFDEAIQQERRLTMLRAAHRPFDEYALKAERQRVDNALRELTDLVAAMSEVIPGSFDNIAAGMAGDVGQMMAMRARVDADSATVDEVYQTYSRLAATQGRAIDITARYAPDAASAIVGANTAALSRAADSMSAAYALTAALVTDEGLDSRSQREFVRRVGQYHALLDSLARGDDARMRSEISTLTADRAWQQLLAFEDSMIDRGAGEQDVPTTTSTTSRTVAGSPIRVDRDALQQNSDAAVAKLRTLWRTQYEQMQHRAGGIADDTTDTAVLVGGLVMAISVVAFLITLLLANRLSQRLRRLRQQTLALAEEQLPEIMARIRTGESVDVDSALPDLAFGRDEIGEVANAFDSAQRAAVSAAVTEAKTRSAVNAVFLNLAHRSQLMAHRQLEVLDAAEARQEDPEMMNLLFQLDHLATRERRNAENLIILGGERPGRRWRNPVSLRDIVRSAIAETQDYSRVQATRLPEARVGAGVVADVIHLLAELIDNATSFSPPGSRVEASGNFVGKGAVVEIIDQGLGIPEAELGRINELLSSAPDFGLMQLSSDSRLGLIVVAVLASRNGIKVRLAESDYGGTKAVVLIPAALLVDENRSEPTDNAPSIDNALIPAGPTRQQPAQAVEKVTEAKAYPVETKSYPVEANSYPTESNSYATETNSYPVESNSYPTESNSYATETNSYPVETKAYPAETKSYRDFLTQPADVPVGSADTNSTRWQQPVDSRPPAPPAELPPATPDGRPPLPRRRRQESLAPQLTESEPAVQAPERDSSGSRSAEQARDLMSAIANGTRQGRHARPATDDQEGIS
ncbi:nitrate- and nitrite sensing domain-containing protein [Nocardia sp. R6R-6]|uniref:nitrate- and nitrite sensing domain-containing protein n=1 Tax=Nocardia sp. R6R-6 TaxID=3459303 RepID=UPI00403DC0A9